MTDFKWRHFQGDVILWAVRWYCRYPISYRDLACMLRIPTKSASCSDAMSAMHSDFKPAMIPI